MEGRTILKRIFAILGVTVVLGYSYFVLDDFVRGPRIIIESPLNGYSTTTPVIVVVGRSVHTNNLAINGAQTPVDLDGNFRGQLILAPGYNIIKVTAKDNYAREVEKTIEMVLVESRMLNMEYGMGAGTATATTTQATKVATTSLDTWVDGAIIN
ncbi:MAG: hypothetical protein HZB10_03360 [Candidatus Yonathbacteria bacterium]|nr:hypothetical protein [Candidatus Yonathbacteria bacterium]